MSHAGGGVTNEDSSGSAGLGGIENISVSFSQFAMNLKLL